MVAGLRPVRLSGEGNATMGKGKRQRQQRRSGHPAQRQVGQQAGQRVEVLADYPYIVDERTASELGREGLAELAANTWPVDCQTCGWDLGRGQPTVHVMDMLAMASATLHHARCQPARWDEHTAPPSRPLVTWAVRSFLLPGQKAGRRDDRPLALLNPSLEQARFVRDNTNRWIINTVAFYRQMGLQTPFRDFVVDKPVPDITADLDGDEVTITMDDTGQTWQVNCDGQVGDAVRRLSGITLGITTAAHPHQISTMAEMIELMRSGRVAMGWIALTGTEQPLQSVEDTGIPTELRTYILHWGRGHASVGELLATTDRALSPQEAQAWALEQIREQTTVDSEALLPWEQISHDHHAWSALNALAGKHYFLRQHTDGWKLVASMSRVDGNSDRDEHDMREWATRAVRVRGNQRIISWVPGPTTTTDFTTLHGSAVPK
jgi:hypothetical protein